MHTTNAFAGNNVPLQQLGISAITFDLDDTLWPCAPVIEAAEKVYFDWICKNFPPIESKYSLEDIIALRRETLESAPQLKSDVTEMRRQATRELLLPYGASEKDVDEAVRVCVEARQKVCLYDEVLAALQQLGLHYRLGSITNGNADLQAIGVAHLFDIELAATMDLPAKPAAEMFLQASNALEAPLERILHVGDHPINDVAAARAAGCKTAWITRYDEVYPADAEPADLHITNLDTLVALAPSTL